MILSIDQGTSSTRCIVFNSQGGRGPSVASSAQTEHAQIYPSAGYVEHDPEEIWEKTKYCVNESIKKLGGESSVKIAAVGITNQRETTVVWNRTTGKPYHNAIVWSDNRTANICHEFSDKKEAYRALTGLPLAPYFSVSKLVYLFRTVPGLREDAEKGDVCFGNIDTWLIWKLTGGRVHATDVTNASRTFLMNIKTLAWDASLLKDFGIPSSILPKIFPSSYIIGNVSPFASDEAALRGILGAPIAGVLGDQQAALFGQTCFDVGDTKCTYGTGAFILMNTGTTCQPSQSGLLTTVGYQTKDGKVAYALEGSVAYSGSVVQWIRDNLEIIKDAKQSEDMASTVPAGCDGVVFVPAFSGLFAPWWKDDARGMICGLTAFHKKEHVVRAALESAAFQVSDVIDAMTKDLTPSNNNKNDNNSVTSNSGSVIKSLRADGGMTANNLFMQFQCDLLDVDLSCPAIVETTALGVCYAAGLAVGIYESLDRIKLSCRNESRRWKPSISSEVRKSLKRQWGAGLQRSMGWLGDVTDTGATSSKSSKNNDSENYNSKNNNNNDNKNDNNSSNPLFSLTTVSMLLVATAVGYILGKRR